MAETAPLEGRLEELLDQETFPPPDEFRESALLTDESVYEKADEDFEAFWAEQADALHWQEKYEQVLDWSDPPFARWFVGGKLNVAENCVDRHVEDGNGDRVAFHWRGEEGEEEDITYADLHRDVQKLANALKDIGVEKGTSSGSSCRWSPRSSWRCSRARGSARRTTSSSAASRSSRSRSAWRSPRPRSW
jgi:acetyl-CoA synthetase